MDEYPKAAPAGPTAYAGTPLEGYDPNKSLTLQMHPNLFPEDREPVVGDGPIVDLEPFRKFAERVMNLFRK